jgi:hypothetical protein
VRKFVSIDSEPRCLRPLQEARRSAAQEHLALGTLRSARHRFRASAGRRSSIARARQPSDRARQLRSCRGGVSECTCQRVSRYGRSCSAGTRLAPGRPRRPGSRSISFSARHAFRDLADRSCCRTRYANTSMTLPRVLSARPKGERHQDNVLSSARSPLRTSRCPRQKLMTGPAFILGS